MSADKKSGDSWRIFCAIELPEEVRARVAAYIEALRESAADARAGWERPEKLHLTLKFLGDTETARIEALQQAATRAAAQVAPFSIAIEATGAFPPRGLPRVLWLGVRKEDGDQLSRLQRRLEDECAVEGFPREARAFRPHLTIARLRTPDGARALADLHRRKGFTSEAFSVSQIVVMRSELGTGGSRYTALSRHLLGQQQTAAGVES